MTSRPPSALQDLQHISEVHTDETLSGHGNLVAPEIDRLPWETVAKNGLDHISTSNMIWVPAAKHPQIAPTEFLEWIKTHGTTTSYNRNPVRRQRSALSVTYTSSEEEEEEDDDDDDDDIEDDDEDDKGNNDDYPSTYTNSNPPIDTALSFDHSALEQDHTMESIAAPLDTTPVLANSERKSLLRRKALSSRGRQNISRAPSAKHATAGQPYDINNNDINGNGSTTSDIIDFGPGNNTGSIPHNDSRQLCDQPVSMNEMVDLGPVPELEPSPQLLLRMQTVETRILERRSSTSEIDIHSFSSSSQQLQPPQSPQHVTPRKRNELRRSVSDRFSWMSNSEKKRTPWIRGLFDKNRRVDEQDKSRSISPPSTEKLTTDSISPIPPIQRSSSHNLISYLSRKLSFSKTKSTDSNNNNHPRRRYSNFLQRSGKRSPYKQQPVEVEANDVSSNGHRLPIHLERGVYRLSHIKLSNPRRPLREQVIISNFMFWYLSLINMHPHQIQQQKQQQQQPQQQQQLYSHQDTTSLSSPSPQPENIRPQMTPSPMSHHTPMKRLSNYPETSQLSTPAPTRSPSPLSSKNKKDKYKPVRNISFGKPPLATGPPLD